MYPLYIHSCIYAIVYPYICPSIYFHRQRFRLRHPADSAVDASFMYGVATLSRIDKIVGLFCKRDLQKRRYSAKETYDLIDPTDRSHPIFIFVFMYLCNCISICLSIYLFLYSAFSSATSGRFGSGWVIHVFTYVFIRLSIYIFIYLFIDLL